jgi:NAD(P)-dependent dehydrogenase (short-subunit alcohol dehydrogenase family)
VSVKGSDSSASGALAGQAAIVTGGGSGIGLACARTLHRDGAWVTLVGRTESKLRDAAATIGDERVQFAIADTVDEDAVAAAVALASKPTGALNIAVAAAGTGAAGPLLATELATWRSVLDTNLTGAFLLIKHAGGAMATAGGGSIVAISSIASTLTHRWMAPYSVSKHGLDMLVRVAADELGAQGIRVSSVQPGLVPTDLTVGITGSEAILGDYIEQMPLGRVGTPEEVGAMVRFLCGPESSWITGVNIPVDGGHTLRRGPDLSVAFR